MYYLWYSCWILVWCNLRGNYMVNSSIFEVILKKWIKSIKEAGFNDPTKEVIKATVGGKLLVIQLYTEDQWEKKTSKTIAQRALKNIGLDKLPDYTVCVDGVIYLVEIVKS